jgi:hypothetical protein
MEQVMAVDVVAGRFAGEKGAVESRVPGAGEAVTGGAAVAGGVVPGGLPGAGDIAGGVLATAGLLAGGLLAGGVVVAGLPGVGIACAIKVGGGAGAADPWPNCHVHEAVPCEPAGCIGPTLPFTSGVLEPVAVALVSGATGADTAMTGNAHSNASPEILPGACGTPFMVTC